MADKAMKKAVGLRLSGEAIVALGELQVLMANRAAGEEKKSAVAVVEETLLEKLAREREKARANTFFELSQRLAPVVAAGAVRPLTGDDVTSAIDEVRDGRDEEMSLA